MARYVQIDNKTSTRFSRLQLLFTENSEQLEGTISDLEASLENQRTEANEAIIQWES